MEEEVQEDFRYIPQYNDNIFLIKKTISFIEVVFLMLVLKIYEKYKLGDMTKEECKKLFKDNIWKYTNIK